MKKTTITFRFKDTEGLPYHAFRKFVTGDQGLKKQKKQLEYTGDLDEIIVALSEIISHFDWFKEHADSVEIIYDGNNYELSQKLSLFEKFFIFIDSNDKNDFIVKKLLE